LLARLLPLLIVAVAVSAFAYMKATQPERPKPQVREKVWLVETQTAQPRTIAPTLTLYGEVESSALVRTAAPGAGQVQQVFVKVGDRVTAGQPMVLIDQRDFDAAVLQAEADVADFEAQLAEHELQNTANIKTLGEERKLLQLARQEMQRIERLKNNNLSSESALNDARETLGRQELSLIQKQLDVDRYATTSNQLKARLARARANLATSRLALERSALTARFDGIVSAVAVAAGDRVRVADPLVTLYPLDSLEVRARIPATYQAEIASQLETGNGLAASARLNRQSFELQLARLAGSADPSGIDAYFKVASEAPGLRVGNLLEINLQRPPQVGVVAVPFSAIYGNDRVFVLDDGRMRAHRVESVGQYRDPQDRAWLLVRNPSIQAGDEIIVTHLPNAVDGLKVDVQGNQAGGERDAS